ncbi:MAG TPA: HEAT repeat domain-containing protein [Vicinamibacteria bacterium]|nr:HEAT repeat domain-containing protein [Vicinamibacteria bacterium]
MRTLAIGLASLVAAALAAAGPPTGVSAGRTESRTAQGGLRASVTAILREGADAKWIGYAVDTDQDGSACCWSSVRNAGDCCGGCRLEGGRGDMAFTVDHPNHVALEGPRRARILLRAAAGRVEQVRVFSEDCALDVGRLPFVWLEGVQGAESADFLGSLIADGGREDHDGRDLTDAPLLALSMHADPHAVDVMVTAARQHSSTRVRKQALFWLSQTASRRVAAELAAAVDDDPDADVRKQAVFALSQMPPAEGVPQLIRVARTNRHHEVRKQAIFWLGQSEDPRALSFFEEILGR